MGTVLYEMLTGMHPFRRGSYAETMAAILGESPPAMGPSTPPALERAVLRCLEKQPENRFASASELAVVLDSVRADTPPPAAARDPRRVESVAVLPFLDMSPAHDQAYLCDGIAEELINALTHVDGLRVCARSSSFQFKTPGVDVRAIGARLGVDTVLEGGVRKVGDRLRVTVQLVDVADGYQRWSHRFDGRIEDVFDIQDEIARSVATALRGFLSPREEEALRRPGTGMETYEYYLRGCQLMRSFTSTAVTAAAQMFGRAIEIDRRYAPAYAGQAMAAATLYEWYAGGESAITTADRASTKALELAPQLSESHTARGYVLATCRRYEEAEPEFEEAIRLNPNAFDAHYLYARSAFAAGEIERSADLFQRAGTVQPEDFQSMVLLGQSLWMLGREEEAREANREAIRRAERHLELHPDEPSVLVNAACVHAKASAKDQALHSLEQTFARGYGKRGWIEHDPDYDLLRDDPRFQAMLEKLT